MKSEAEVRAHRDNLRTHMAMTRGRAGVEHEAEWTLRMRWMEASMQALSWALGELPGMQPLVDEMGRDATACREGR